jgi:hypothetical protein
MEDTSSPINFSVVEPITYCPELRCLVLDEAPGCSLQDVLRNGGDGITAARCVARALAAFNQKEIPGLRLHSAAEQIESLNRTAELLRWACPASSARLNQILQEVNAGLRDSACVPILWDPKTDHVFLDGERVTLIDLDDVSLGDPARDPAHLAAHIACRIEVPDLSAEQARAVAGVLVEEYFAQVPATWREQFALQFAIAVVEAACGLFKRQEPRWAERAAAALEEAHSCF